MTMTTKKKLPSPLQKWKIRRILGAPGRLARRRGFGIHSPFAYEFVRKVISQHYAYYCYPRLTKMAKSNSISSRKLRLLFRLALFLHPEKISVYTDTKQAIMDSLRAGAPDVVEAGADADLIVTDGSSDTGTLERCFREGGTVVVINPSRNREAVRRIWASSTHGMLFRGSGTAIFIGRKCLPHQMFNIWI